MLGWQSPGLSVSGTEGMTQQVEGGPVLVAAGHGQVQPLGDGEAAR
jgi:hypothetical protein